MKLYCLPYAGGSASFYNSWRGLLHRDIDLHPIELPGRGTRFSEPLSRSILDASTGVLSEIQGELLDSPYSLFGHSMGAEIVFRLLQQIRKNGLPEPEHVFFSGRKPPHFYEKNNYKDFSDKEFLDLLKKYGGTPPDFFDNPSLVSLFLPIIRNDFEIIDENIIDTETVEPFHTDFSILIGEEDDVAMEEAKSWSQYTTQECSVFTFPGGHFFIEESKNTVIEIINESLIALINAEKS